MTALEEAAGFAAEHLVSDGLDRQEAFDPAMILVIADLIVKIIELFQDCKKSPEESSKVMNEPKFFHRALVRRAVRRDMGWKDFRKHGDRVVKALLATGEKNMNPELVAELYEEV